ncbi:hypothetical protein HRG_012371 [Hirsutella rhossiliensis]
MEDNNLIWDRGRRRTAEDVHRARPSSATVDTQPGGAQYPGDLTRRTEAGSSPGNGPWQEAQADDLAEVERSTESFHFYLDRLVFKYNTDEEGLNGNNNVVWYEILQTLPDQMMRRVEGFGGKRARRATQTPEILLAPSPDVRQRAADREGAGQAAHLIQRDSQEFGKFLPEFEETLTKAGGASWDNASKLAWLRNSISPALREQLVPVIMPKDYNEYIQRLHPIAWAFEHTAKFKALQRKQGSRGQRDQGQASGIGNIQVAGNDNTPAPSATLPAEQNARDARDHDGDVIMTVTRTQGRVREDGRTARVKWNELSRRRSERVEVPRSLGNTA